MSDIQKLLDRSADLELTGRSNSQEREEIHTIIRLKRGPAPVCFGLDDCSSAALMSCPWRIDCGV